MKTMKEYMKPNVEVVNIKIESLLDITSTNLENVKVEGEFEGGDGDARGGGWFDDDDY